MSRILHVGGKASDLFDASVPHLNLDHQGYAPEIKGVCGGDYFHIKIDLDTLQVVGMEKLTDQQLSEIFN